MKYRHYIDALQTKDHQILQAGWLQRLVIRIFAAHLYAFIGRIFHYAYKRGRIRSAELHALLALTERALWQRESGRYAAKNSDNAQAHLRSEAELGSAPGSPANLKPPKKNSK